MQVISLGVMQSLSEPSERLSSFICETKITIFARMNIKSLSLVNFKNYNGLEINLSDKINCFTGNNGAGKTNILDAIYYLSFSKSFFSSVDSFNIKHGQELFVIQGSYTIKDNDEIIYCGYEKGKKKKVKRNKKEYERLADHIGLIPLVMITPSDISLIIGGSDERRKFMDGIISQYNRNYLYDLQRYNKVLLQRNYLLKDAAKTQRNNDDVIEIYNQQLIETGNRIFEERKKFSDEIIPVFQKYFEHISMGNEKVQLNYSSGLHKKSMDILLEESKTKDKIARTTTEGIHKDDLELLLGDYLIRKLGSQGQQKSYLIALKLAQFEYIQKICGFKPILLLDDVFDKLDSSRVEQIIKLVSQHSFGQIFITDTNSNRINKVLNSINDSYFHFNVDNAELTRVYEKD